MNRLFDYQSFLLQTKIVQRVNSKDLNKNLAYLYNNISNFFIYLSNQEEEEDINFCEQLYNNVLQSALKCNYTKEDINKSLFIISLRKDITIKENSLAYLYQQHFCFEDNIHFINQDMSGAKFFFLLRVLDKQLYKLASLILNEWIPEKSNLNNDMLSTIPVNTNHPLLNNKIVSFESNFSAFTSKFNKPNMYLPGEYIVYYFYINSMNQSIKENKQHDFYQFKKIFDNKIIINEILKENILSLYIKKGIHLSSNSFNLLHEWDICSHKGKAIIHIVEKLSFYISEKNEVDLKEQELSFIMKNSNKIFNFLKKENLNFVDIWSNYKITQLLNNPRSSYQSPTSSHTKMYEDLMYLFRQLNYLTDYFNLPRNDLKEIKNKVEYNLIQLGNGIKDPISEQSFIETSLKINELFYQYSQNTNDTYIQPNKNKIRL